MKLIPLQSFLIIALSALASAAVGQDVQIGDEVCVDGYIMDEYCLVNTGGVLFDAPAIRTLEQPGEHSVHCLVDVSLCRNSPYNILADPSEGETLYSRAYEVDEAGKQLLIGIAREVGQKNNNVFRCSTCTDDGVIAKGFRASVSGVVIGLADGDRPPQLQVRAARHSFGTSLCPLVTEGDDGAQTPSPPTEEDEEDEEDAAWSQLTGTWRVVVATLSALSMALSWM